MNLTETIKNSFKMMWRFKGRTFIVMLGLIVGISMLTLALSISSGTRDKLLGQLDAMFNANSILVAAGAGGMGGGRQSGPQDTLVIEDLRYLADQIENIIAWDPVQSTYGQVQYQGNSEKVLLMGHSSSADFVWHRGVKEGEFFSEDDINSRARVTLLGSVLAKTLFANEKPIGKTVQIKNSPYKVIGILEEQGVDPHGMNRDNEAHVPVTTMMKRLMNVDHLLMGKFIVENEKITEQTVVLIEKLMRERHGLEGEQESDFNVITPKEEIEMINEANQVFDRLLPGVAIVSLLVAMVIIANLMLIMVNERREEIALRKSVGAKSSEILWQIITEASFIACIGGLIGSGLGLAGVYVVAMMFDIPAPNLGLQILIGILISVAIGVLASIYPAREAAKMDPASTL